MGLKSITTWVLMIECPVSARHPSKRGELKSPTTPICKRGEESTSLLSFTKKGECLL